MIGEKDLTLHYIDKIHVSLIETGKAINRNLIYIVILSLLLIALGSGLLEAEKNISVAGLVFSFPYWTISYAGAWILIFYYVSFIGLIGHETRLRDAILRLYKKIGFSDQSMEELQANPLEYPNFVTTSVSERNIGIGLAETPIRLIIMAVILILPLFAEGYVAYRLVAIQNYSIWMILSFAAILLVGITYLVALLRATLK